MDGRADRDQSTGSGQTSSSHAVMTTVFGFSKKVYEPFFRRWAERFSRSRVLQQGKIQIYLVYIMFMVVLALDWVSLRGWWGTS